MVFQLSEIMFPDAVAGLIVCDLLGWSFQKAAFGSEREKKRKKGLDSN